MTENRPSLRTCFFKWLDPRGGFFDEYWKKTKFPDQMIIANRCRWIVAAEHNEFFI